VISDDEWLRTIKLAAEYAGDADANLRVLVAKARAEGVAWKIIGDALGVTRQAAHQRFKDV
jgi:hypothetical protein